jgi:hypothetical protein
MHVTRNKKYTYPIPINRTKTIFNYPLKRTNGRKHEPSNEQISMYNIIYLHSRTLLRFFLFKPNENRTHSFQVFFPPHSLPKKLCTRHYTYTQSWASFNCFIPAQFCLSSLTLNKSATTPIHFLQTPTNSISRTSTTEQNSAGAL